jgi:adenine-specific DNA-methyltransferase
MFEADNPQMVGKTFAEIKVVYVERLPLPDFSKSQASILRSIVETLLILKREETDHPEPASTRDQLMLAYWERVLNGLVYELYFPEEVHGAGLRLFDLVAAAGIPDLSAVAEKARLPTLRQAFETLQDPDHPLRQALDQLQTLETVKIIEGR